MNFLISIKKFPNVIPFHGYWLDIGRPDDYAEAIEKFAENPKKFLELIVLKFSLSSTSIIRN